MATTIKDIFSEGVNHKASDVHLVANEPPIIRVNGKLTRLEKHGNLSQKQIEDLTLSILNNKQKDKYINFRELDLSYQLDSGVRFRVNLHFEKPPLMNIIRVAKS